MNKKEFADIEKLLVLDGYKKVVEYVHELENYSSPPTSEPMKDLLKTNEILYKRVNELLKQLNGKK